MKTENEAQVSSPTGQSECQQLHIVVDDCKIKLSFPDKPEGSIPDTIKRMMLGSVIQK